MAEFIRYRARSRAEAIARVREVVRGITQGGGRQDLAEIALTPGAVALLSKIQQAFIVKSRGGTDEAGIQWAHLQRSTIAQRRIGAGDLLAIGVKGAKVPKNRVRGLLTASEDARWRGIFASRLAHFRAIGMDEGSAKGRAAQIAWAMLKASGAKTKLDALGSRQVDIGRDSNALFSSLTPGLESPADQVREVDPGRLTVGSNVPHAAHFHKKRPLWPTDGRLPDSWNQAIAAAVGRGLLRAIIVALQGRG